MMIIVIIVILTVPLVYSWFKVYDYTSTENSIEAEFKKLGNTIRLLYFNGNGRTRVDMNLEAGLITKLDYGVLGDGPYRNMITYKLTEGNERHILFSDPYIPMGLLSKNNENVSLKPMNLSYGTYSLVLECRNDLDCDGDGIHDIYIAITLGGA